MNRTPYISEEQREGWEKSVIDNEPAKAGDEAGQVEADGTEVSTDQTGV